MREVKTCLRYPGGKFYGYKVLYPFLQSPHSEFREVFAGGASVFLGKALVETNWINDKDAELVNFYRLISDPVKRRKLSKLLDKEVATRERHAEVLKMDPKSELDHAFKYFYLNRTSFSGIMHKPRWGYALGSSITPDKWASIIEPVGEKMANAKITQLDFRDVITAPGKKNDVLLYLDPPYFQASKAIYKNEFSVQDHIDLAQLLKKTPFRFVLSYEDSPQVRELYQWANLNTTNFTYYMSEARRQDGRELIITNFEDPRLFVYTRDPGATRSATQ